MGIVNGKLEDGRTVFFLVHVYRDVYLYREFGVGGNAHNIRHHERIDNIIEHFVHDFVSFGTVSYPFRPVVYFRIAFRWSGIFTRQDIRAKFFVIFLMYL